jgi:hypothetical protein
MPGKEKWSKNLNVRLICKDYRDEMMIETSYKRDAGTVVCLERF